MSLVCSRGAGQAAFQLQSLWSTDMIDPKPCQSSLEYPRVSIRQRTGRNQSIACPWWQCQKLEAKIGSLKAIRQRLQSDEMNDTSWYFQFTRCFQQSNGAKVDIEMSRSPSSIERYRRYRTYQYSYNDNQWQMTANSWRWHVNTLQAKPSHEIKLAAQQWFCNMSSRCLRQLWEQAAQQSPQPRVTILSLLDFGIRWFLPSWSENDQDGTARNWHFEQGW